MHWSLGLYGYFPTYTLGAIYSVQIFNAAKKAIPDLEGKIRNGEFAPLKEWYLSDSSPRCCVWSSWHND